MGVERERVKKIKKVCKKMLTVQQTCYIINFVAGNSNNKEVPAEVAELADAQDLKSCGG